MKIRLLTPRLLILTFFLTLNQAFAVCPDDSRAKWMEGKWGVHFQLLSGQSAESQDVSQILEEIEALKTVSYIHVNVSAMAFGGRFTAPNPFLDQFHYPADDPSLNVCVPERDLLGEVLNAADKAGLRVLVYMKATGPLMNENDPTHSLYASVPDVSARFQAWCDAETTYDSIPNNTKRYQYYMADEVVEYYSLQYGDLIDGWWFDKGKTIVDLATAQNGLTQHVPESRFGGCV